MRRSSAVVAALSAALVLFSSSSAGAHAGFVGAPSGYPANTDQALTLNVPHERDDVTYSVDVVVAMPSGWTALSCQTKATWECSLGTVDARQVVRFTKASGAEAAEAETFQFGARTASAAGSYAFPTVQTYNTGEIVRWIGGAGTDKPAPILVTLPGGTAPQSTPSTTNPDAPPATTSASTSITISTSTTSMLPSTTPAVAVPSTIAVLPDDDGGGNGALVAALVAIAVLAVGVGSVFVYRHRRLPGQCNEESPPS